MKLASREDFPPSEDDLAAGGFIMDVGVHDFDTARWLLGKDPDTVFTFVHSPVFRDADLDNAYVTIGLDGAVATTHLSRTSKIGMDIRCEVLGPDGSIFLTAGSRDGCDLRVRRRSPPPRSRQTAASGSAMRTRARSTTSVRRAGARRRRTRRSRTTASR